MNPLQKNLDFTSKTQEKTLKPVKITKKGRGESQLFTSKKNRIESGEILRESKILNQEQSKIQNSKTKFKLIKDYFNQEIKGGNKLEEIKNGTSPSFSVLKSRTLIRRNRTYNPLAGLQQCEEPNQTNSGHLEKQK